MRVLIKDVLSGKYTNKEVLLKGWVYRHRTSGNLCFVIIRDCSGIIQCVIRKNKVDDKSWKNSEELYIESSIILKGVVKKDERAPGGYEVQVSHLDVVSKGLPFPISKDLSDEFLLDVRHLWLRSRRMSAIMKSRHYLVNYLREYLDSQGFYEVVPPIITTAEVEGGSTLFEFDFFGKKAYLSQSGQLYGEALIYSLEKIYFLAPSFRAEKSRTIRHLAEYWHLEPEMAWFNHEKNMELQENMIEYAVQNFIKNHEDLLSILGRDVEDLKKVRTPFPRMSYEEMIEKINELGGKIEFGEDPGADEEAILTKEYKVPLFVHHYPKKIKAFYMREDPKKPGFVLNDDLLAPEGHGEIIGGSEREWDYDKLVSRIKEFGLNLKDYDWYLDLRKYGSVPHSGFGLGIERFVKWVLGLKHIRDAIPFPRSISRSRP